MREEIFDLAETIYSDTLDERDRFGDRCTFVLKATRARDSVWILFVCNNPEVDERTIEAFVPIEDAPRKTLEIWEGYDCRDAGYAEPRCDEARFRGLEDHYLAVARELDELYAPDERITPSKPSEILRRVTSNRADSDEHSWCWKGGVLYLTLGTRVRASMHSSKLLFDESLAQVLSFANIPTKFVDVSRTQGNFPMHHRVEIALRRQEEEALRSALRAIESKIEHAQSEIDGWKVNVAELKELAYAASERTRELERRAPTAVK